MKAKLKAWWERFRLRYFPTPAEAHPNHADVFDRFRCPACLEEDLRHYREALAKIHAAEDARLRRVIAEATTDALKTLPEQTLVKVRAIFERDAR